MPNRFLHSFESFRKLIEDAEKMAEHAEKLWDKIPPGMFRTETVTTRTHHANGEKDSESHTSVETTTCEVLAAPNMVHLLINGGFRRLKLSPVMARKMAGKLIECADAAEKMGENKK